MKATRTVDDDGRPITAATAEWDDQGEAFRVYLERTYVDPDEYRGEEKDPNELRPLRSDILGDTVDARLYLAAFCAHPRDFRGAHERLVGFDTRPAAERAAKAVTKELKKIARGEPGPSEFEVQVALVRAKGKKR